MLINTIKEKKIHFNTITGMFTVHHGNGGPASEYSTYKEAVDSIDKKTLPVLIIKLSMYTHSQPFFYTEEIVYRYNGKYYYTVTNTVVQEQWIVPQELKPELDRLLESWNRVYQSYGDRNAQIQQELLYLIRSRSI